MIRCRRGARRCAHVSNACVYHRTCVIGAGRTAVRPYDNRRMERTKPNIMRKWDDFNTGIVEEFRANGGKVGGRFANRPMMILTTTGAKSGLPRTVPLVYTMDGDRIVIIASKGGAPTHPDWYHNLIANREVTVEIGTERFDARARVTEGEERDRLYDAMAAQMPFFAEYKRTTERRIPLVVLERRAPSP